MYGIAQSDRNNDMLRIAYRIGAMSSFSESDKYRYGTSDYEFQTFIRYRSSKNGKIQCPQNLKVFESLNMYEVWKCFKFGRVGEIRDLFSNPRKSKIQRL